MNLEKTEIFTDIILLTRKLIKIYEILITEQKLRVNRTNKNVNTSKIHRARFKFSRIVPHWPTLQIQRYK